MVLLKNAHYDFNSAFAHKNAAFAAALLAHSSAFQKDWEDALWKCQAWRTLLWGLFQCGTRRKRDKVRQQKNVRLQDHCKELIYLQIPQLGLNDGYFLGKNC